MLWFLVAFTYLDSGDVSRVLAREVGQGPVAMVACNIEVEVSQSMGAVPYGFDDIDGSAFYCMDAFGLCDMQGLTAQQFISVGNGLGNRAPSRPLCPS